MTWNKFLHVPHGALNLSFSCCCFFWYEPYSPCFISHLTHEQIHVILGTNREMCQCLNIDPKESVLRLFHEKCDRSGQRSIFSPHLPEVLSGWSCCSSCPPSELSARQEFQTGFQTYPLMQRSMRKTDTGFNSLNIFQWWIFYLACECDPSPSPSSCFSV